MQSPQLAPDSPLLALAPEILQAILCHLDGVSIASFSLTAQYAHQAVFKGNQQLWRAVFLHDFDDPWDAFELLLPTAREAVKAREEAWDWQYEALRRFRARARIKEVAAACAKGVSPATAAAAEAAAAAAPSVPVPIILPAHHAALSEAAIVEHTLASAPTEPSTDSADSDFSADSQVSNDSTVSVNIEEDLDMDGEYASRELPLSLDRHDKAVIETVMKGVDDLEETIETLLDIFDTCRPYHPATHIDLTLKRPKGEGPPKNLTYLYSLFQGKQIAQLFYIHDYSSPSAPITAFAATQPGPWLRSSGRRAKHLVSLASSRLHLLHGLTARERTSRSARGKAKQLVYCLEKYGWDNEFGPYRSDRSGCVDWNQLEAIASVIGRNFDLVAENEQATPKGFIACGPYTVPPNLLAPQDWAGIEGLWYGAFSYLDYADLLFYNVGHRPEARPSLTHVDEAVGGVMTMNLRLDDSIRGDSLLRTDLPICKDLPVLYFSGVSGGHGAYRPQTRVKGRVSLMPGAREVRWRWIVNYGGSDRWQLDGVQPGGIRSAAVFGTWSDCDHDDASPVGPFVYWHSSMCQPFNRAS
ncbi:uncharacterized protein L969DRAFT_14343 [Mixia osmundae IAM 14324]|uniref:F-box domain-containing protein n=1 Tax=Mixia osmundae (strain CBS 9802 / IAM 14324 / JCM 22182 / KY 12970) TaxID=764103 RepID=G7DZY5_MIXOS|nr:uncharacterized protein L969DRAFT_14343 [Mixia osmundae IAM 14324]KEI42136.1 hypothetical protein L969DRAFT_14343 [Mixia osmundae IAM 14324]GAA96145.1 hypothetical protein E5Q_02806 [Mixia osmundae IAM 14324]